MSNLSLDDNWSPADDPYAIAVSEAQWWLRMARLAAARLRDADDPRFLPFSSRQMDSRVLVFALRQLLTAVRLEQVAIEELGLDPSVNQELQSASLRFQTELPGIQDMRDALTHFDEWARGVGRGAQKALRDEGHAVREIARLHWGFGYEPGSHSVRLGPHRFAVETAIQAATELGASIYAAAHQVDARRAANSAMTVGGDRPGANAAE